MVVDYSEEPLPRSRKARRKPRGLEQCGLRQNELGIQLTELCAGGTPRWERIVTATPRLGQLIKMSYVSDSVINFFWSSP